MTGKGAWSATPGFPLITVGEAFIALVIMPAALMVLVTGADEGNLEDEMGGATEGATGGI